MTDYIFKRVLPDGRVIGIHRLLFHWTMHIDISDTGYEDHYCYRHLNDAIVDAQTWDGVGDPPGRWHKHPSSDRRRNPDTGFTWDEKEARDSRGNKIGA